MSTATITVDQFVAATPETVWRTLTEPELHARWWAPGDIGPDVGHRFTLEMPGWGRVACEVRESVRPELFVYGFGVDTVDWTLTWRLVAEGRGTRVLLEHSGFDLDDKRGRDAFERMGPGWRDTVVPRLAELAESLD